MTRRARRPPAAHSLAAVFGRMHAPGLTPRSRSTGDDDFDVLARKYAAAAAGIKAKVDLVPKGLFAAGIPKAPWSTAWETSFGKKKVRPKP